MALPLKTDDDDDDGGLASICVMCREVPAAETGSWRLVWLKLA
jgi:hypothetical protein